MCMVRICWFVCLLAVNMLSTMELSMESQCLLRALIKVPLNEIHIPNPLPAIYSPTLISSQ
jgi:hypothetical protein